MDSIPYILEKTEQMIAIDSPTGYTEKASDFLIEELRRLGYAPEKTNKGGVVCSLGGQDAGDGLCLFAHVDTLGAMVSQIKSNGRLKLAPLGGVAAPNVEGENCRIRTRDGAVFTGTFQLENASVHVNSELRTKERNFDTMELVLDEDVRTPEETKALGIRNGDIVCFEPRFTLTPSGYIKSRFLDDKLSAAILLALAREIKEENLLPRRSLSLHITVYEEVGHGAAASVPKGVTELLSIDMGCVGEGLECTEKMVSICAKNRLGPSNYEMTTKLCQLAQEHQLNYTVDLYPFYSADGDAALRGGCDARHALIGPGVYASHGYERSHVEGARNTFELLKAYALS